MPRLESHRGLVITAGDFADAGPGLLVVRQHVAVHDFGRRVAHHAVDVAELHEHLAGLGFRHGVGGAGVVEQLDDVATADAQLPGVHRLHLQGFHGQAVLHGRFGQQGGQVICTIPVFCMDMELGAIVALHFSPALGR